MVIRRIRERLIRSMPSIRDDLTRLLADLDAKLWLTRPGIDNARRVRALIEKEQQPR